MLIWPGKIIGIFNNEPEMIEIGSNFLMISVVAMMLSFDMVFMDSLSGGGDTFPPMLISILATWLVPLPLAFILPNVGGLGVYGIRWALVAGRVAGSLAALIYFRLGRWKRIVL
jgi:MATE family multidrug resistance protein